MNRELLEETLVPYILTLGPNVEHLNHSLDIGKKIEILRVEDPNNAEFCHILNAVNQLAFGGSGSMGMPMWVMLDCGILPSAMVGFMQRREHVEPRLAAALDLDDYDGYVPISEYCACPTVEQGSFSGFSLLSQIVGQGIATRTKALALAVYGARTQVGVTQFYNPAIRVHVRFGPMEITVHRPSIHTYPDDSFVYRLELPPHEILTQMARGEARFGWTQRPEGVRWAFDPDSEISQGRLAEHLQSGGRAWIVPPGWRATEDGCELSLILG